MRKGCFYTQYTVIFASGCNLPHYCIQGATHTIKHSRLNSLKLYMPFKLDWGNVHAQVDQVTNKLLHLWSHISSVCSSRSHAVESSWEQQAGFELCMSRRQEAIVWKLANINFGDQAYLLIKVAQVDQRKRQGILFKLLLRILCIKWITFYNINGFTSLYTYIMSH